MVGMKRVVDEIYRYVLSDDMSVERINNVLDFVIGLRHSYVDNDKPMSSMQVNMEILRIAEYEGLRVHVVDIPHHDRDSLVECEQDE